MTMETAGDTNYSCYLHVNKKYRKLFRDSLLALNHFASADRSLFIQFNAASTCTYMYVVFIY